MSGMKAFSAYSDESGINPRDPYTSIAVVSGEREALISLRNKLSRIVDEKKVGEVKFVKVVRPKSTLTQAANSFIRCAITDFAICRKVRIDILTNCNVKDNTNTTIGPPLERMYYVLLSHIIRQWHETTWNFYPDSNSKINWAEIISYLAMTRLHKRRVVKAPLLIDIIMDENPKFRFNEIRQVDSASELLSQLADLFAGVARYSHGEGTRCSQFVENYRGIRQGRLSLFTANNTQIEPIRECRYRLIGGLYHICGKHRLFVSLKTKKHLWTRYPSYPINFWDYEPRSGYNRAPSKK